MGTKKNPTNLVEGVKIMLPVKFRWILFGCFREEVENVSANQRSGQSSCFSDRREKHKLSKRRIKSCFLSSFVEFRSAIAEKSKMSQPIRGQCGHLDFPIGSKKHKLCREHWDFASCNNSRKSWSNGTKVEVVLYIYQDKFLYKISSKYMKGRLRNVRKLSERTPSGQTNGLTDGM